MLRNNDIVLQVFVLSTFAAFTVNAYAIETSFSNVSCPVEQCPFRNYFIPEQGSLLIDESPKTAFMPSSSSGEEILGIDIIDATVEVTEPWKLAVIFMTMGFGGLLYVLLDGKKKTTVFDGLNSTRALLVTSFLLCAAAVIQFNETEISSYFKIACQNLFGWYMTKLETFPLMTKSLTTAVIQFIGDFLAQGMEEAFRIRTSAPFDFHAFVKKDYDLRRGLSIALDGLVLSGPLLHFVFEWLESALPTSDSAICAVIHVLVNDFFLDSFYLFLSFIFVAIAEGHWNDLKTIFQKDFVDTVKASWGSSLGFMPIEFLSFRYLPVHFRALAMNFVDVVWGAIVSFTAHRSRNEMKERN